MDRRNFLRTATAGAYAAASSVRPKADATTVSVPPNVDTTGVSADREYWISVMVRLADPVLTNLANGTLKQRMPLEQAAGADRRSVTHLEALGRLMAGIAPWIELPADATPEGRARARYAALAHRAIARAVDPSSPDLL